MIGIALSFSMLFIHGSGVYLVFAAIFIVMMIVPGHIMNKQMKKQMFKELNPILHSQLRLAIMSILLTVEEAEFVYLKEKTQSTAGNLSVQLDKLSEAGYIEVEKSFVAKGRDTACRMTAGGRKAMEEYVETLKEYLSGL